MEKRFVTAINCMDDRTQIPVITYLQKNYNADYVDMITEPGPVKILTAPENSPAIESIKKRVEISIKKHGSNLIAAVAHHDCAGNPVRKETQIIQLSEAINVVKSWGFNAKVIGLWVDDRFCVSEKLE